MMGTDVQGGEGVSGACESGDACENVGALLSPTEISLALQVHAARHPASDQLHHPRRAILQKLHRCTPTEAPTTGDV